VDATPPSAVTGHHLHLWVLADGTPAHAPPEILTRNEDGEVACHLCGRWFNHLGLHLRRHGWTAQQYRAAVGLALHEPLCAPHLSGSIAARQRQVWNSDPDIRERFAAGMARAAVGELAQDAGRAARRRERQGTVPAAVLRERARQLTAGRATQSRRRRQRDNDLLDADHGRIRARLLNEYRAGASLQRLNAELDLSYTRIREQITAAGIPIRGTGTNAPASKHARARLIDDQVATRVGTDDLRSWLLGRRADGSTLAELATVTGRSITWVRARLTGQTTTRPTTAATGPAVTSKRAPRLRDQSPGVAAIQTTPAASRLVRSG
jgi:hypothetical protein